MRAAGRAYLAQTGRFASVGQWLRGAAATALLVLAFAGVLRGLPGPALIWAALAGLGGFGLLATLCHDAAHGALGPSRWLNRAVLTVGFGVFGISGALWGWRHVALHHRFPNVEGTDIDGEGGIAIRLAPTDPWRWWHRAQPFYAPFLYLLVFAHLAWVKDFAFLRRARREAPAQFAGTGALLEFAVVKIAHAAFALLLPWLVLQPPLWALALGYLIFTGIASLLFVLLAAGTHLSEAVDFVQPKEGQIAHDWVEHQLRTTIDWAPTRAWAVAVSGGANAHAAHHIFPHAAHCHAPVLSAIVSDQAARAGMTHRVSSFGGMLGAHLAHLRHMARRPSG
ncbi:MAG: fatty acid desaturase [Pseudomonadota bacterium]